MNVTPPVEVSVSHHMYRTPSKFSMVLIIGNSKRVFLSKALTNVCFQMEDPFFGLD